MTGKHQTANGKLPTSKTTITNSNFSNQSETLVFFFSFDLTEAGPKTSNWIKLPGKQIEIPNQEEHWSNQK